MLCVPKQRNCSFGGRRQKEREREKGLRVFLSPLPFQFLRLRRRLKKLRDWIQEWGGKSKGLPRSGKSQGILQKVRENLISCQSK